MTSDLAKRCYRKYVRFVALAEALEKLEPDNDGWDIVLRFMQPSTS